VAPPVLAVVGSSRCGPGETWNCYWSDPGGGGLNFHAADS
jgi:hypothetical protein